MPKPSLFQVGQRAESRSIIKGFRGAWFRCEINEVTKSKGELRYCVRYYDYDDDGLEWIKLHQRPQKGKRLLMLRPQYPLTYMESELHSIGIDAVTEVAVVMDGRWSVGDKVDWWKDECFWSGTVTEVLADDTVKLELLPEPLGEGGDYTVRCSDLRPSLDWSPDSGWTFAGPGGSQDGHSHARLIQPVKQALPPASSVHGVDEINQNAAATPRSSLDFNDSISSHTSESSLPLLSRLIHSKASAKASEKNSGVAREQNGENMDLDTGGFAGKRSCSDSVSSSYVGDILVEVPAAISAEKQGRENMPAKKMRSYGAVPLNSTASDRIESAIMDLEELVCRVKWLKQILKSDGPSTSVSKKWEFLEHPTVSAPK